MWILRAYRINPTFWWLQQHMYKYVRPEKLHEAGAHEILQQQQAQAERDARMQEEVREEDEMRAQHDELDKLFFRAPPEEGGAGLAAGAHNETDQPSMFDGLEPETQFSWAQVNDENIFGDHRPFSEDLVVSESVNMPTDGMHAQQAPMQMPGSFQGQTWEQQQLLLQQQQQQQQQYQQQAPMQPFSQATSQSLPGDHAAQMWAQQQQYQPEQLL